MMICQMAFRLAYQKVPDMHFFSLCVHPLHSVLLNNILHTYESIGYSLTNKAL